MLLPASLWQSAQDFLASPSVRFHSALPSSTQSVAGFAASSSCIARVSADMNSYPDLRSAAGISPPIAGVVGIDAAEISDARIYTPKVRLLWPDSRVFVLKLMQVSTAQPAHSTMI